MNEKVENPFSFNAKIEKAKEAIDDVFSDTTVSVDETKAALQELIDEIQIILEAAGAL